MDKVPILCEVHCAEPILMGTLDEIESLLPNTSLGINHDALSGERVRDFIILLIVDVASNLRNMIAAKFLCRFKTGGKHFFVILGIEDDTLAGIRIVKGDIGYHLWQQVFVLFLNGRKLEMDDGSFDDGILLGAFLTVEVKKERFKDGVHLVFVPGKVHELVFPGMVLLW